MKSDYNPVLKNKLLQELRCEHYFRTREWKDFNKHFFNQLAHKYDATNAVHSFGAKAGIDKKCIELLPIAEHDRILDVCTGSGDIAIALSQRYPKNKIVGVDVSENMLAVARKKSLAYPNVAFAVDDALALSFPDNSFDGAIISFGLRNLADLQKGLHELRRVVKPGGFVCNIDQGKPSHPLLKVIYNVYFYHVAPIIGKLLFHIGEFNSFRYLPYSNRYFPSQQTLVTMLQEVGFSDVRNYDYLCGAVACQTMRVKK